MDPKRRSSRHRSWHMLSISVVPALAIAIGAAFAAKPLAREHHETAARTSSAAALHRHAPAAPEGHAATRMLDGRVLITGGFSDLGGRRTVLDIAEVFDPTDESVHPVVARMKSSRAFHQATLIESGPARGKVLLTAGFSTVALDREMTAEIFDPANNSFTAVPAPMATARAGHAATFVSSTGKVLITGGSVAGGAIYFDDHGAPGVHLEGGTLTSAEELYDPRDGSFSLVSNPVVAIASARSPYLLASAASK